MKAGGFSSLLRFRRPEDGRLLGGVCAALASRFELDVTLVRLAFFVFAFARGLGILLYVLLWLVLPSERSRAESIAEAAKENVSSSAEELSRAGAGLRDAWDRAGDSDWPRPLGRRWLAILLIASGAGILLWSFGAYAWLTGPRVLGLAALAIGAAALVSLAQGPTSK